MNKSVPVPQRAIVRRIRTEARMKITATVREACEMSGLGKTKLYQLIGEQKISTTTVGRRRLVKVDSLRALLEAA
jgi:excisionase family DNA binding protein